jgi:LmbE family N-acetylglucosaminyl deacetylase
MVALVLAPHPDDELIGAGGTILRIKAAGGSVHILHLTNGRSAAALGGVSEPLRSSVRLDEARRVASDLGAQFEAWNDTSDGTLSSNPLTQSRMVDVLRRTNPDIVFLPFVEDDHPDHLATNRILADALRVVPELRDSITIYGYDVWSASPANCAVDVTATHHRKLELLRTYRTALRVVDYVARCREVSTLNSQRYLGSDGFVEAFVAQRYDEFLNSVDFVSKSDIGSGRSTSLNPIADQRSNK